MEPYLIGKKYYIRFSFLGKQYRISLKVTNQKVAQQIADQIQRGIDRGIFDSFEKGTDSNKILQVLIARPGLRAEEALEAISEGSKRRRLREAVEAYLQNCQSEHTASNYKNEVRVFNHFLESMKVVYVHQVTMEMIEKWRNARIERVSKSTVNRELKMIKRFFKQALEKGYLAKSPAENIKTYREAEKAIKHLSDGEIKKLLEYAPKDLQRIISFLLLTGLRYGELCHLMWPDLDFRRNQIIIQPKKDWHPKNFKKRIIPMHPQVIHLLEDVPRNGSEYVFPDENGKCAYHGLRNRIYRVFERAKVHGNVKDLRSTFASNAVMSGMPIYTVSKLLGHHDVKITEKHYAHLAPDYMGNAITMLQPKWGTIKERDNYSIAVL